MNTEYIQNLRYKLQKRIRKLNSIDDLQLFHYSLKQLWEFFHSQDVIIGILEYLEKRFPDTKKISEEIFIGNKLEAFESEYQHVSASYFLIKKCVESDNPGIESDIGINYVHENGKDFFYSYFVETLYEYIDEQLDDQKALLALLRRYKHRCEWFKRDHLYQTYIDDTRNGERKLAKDMYEYLYDQGFEFYIEPSSISGEVDLISAQTEREPLIADAKIFNPDNRQDKTYLKKGFHQIYQYTLDFNEPFGYLIIFKLCESDLKLSLKNQEQETPFIIHNNKTIFLLIIDIFPHEKSASQRGKLKHYTINEDEFTIEIE